MRQHSKLGNPASPIICLREVRLSGFAQWIIRFTNQDHPALQMPQKTIFKVLKNNKLLI